MTKAKTSFKRIDIPMYKVVVFVSVGLSTEMLRKRLIEQQVDLKFVDALLKDSELGDEYGGLSLYEENCPYFVIRYRDEDVFFENPGLISHESFHIVGAIMELIQNDYSFDNDEPWAYLLEYLVSEHPLYDINF